VKPLGEDVKRELERFGPVAGMPELVEAWPVAVGETIAQNAWPARIARDGTVHVNTADAIWAFELTSRAAEIAERLGVAQLRFAPGRLPEAAPEPSETLSIERRDPSEEHRREGERLAATIEDENLRKIVARAAAASLENGSDSRFLW
jgi:Dna[CI] antecedent, DciA